MGSAKYDYDLIAIGAGTAGVRATRTVAGWGGKAAVVEMPLFHDKYFSTVVLGGVGGGCVLRGCVPKKLLQRAADMVQTFEDANAFGWEIDPLHLPHHNWKKLVDAERDAVIGLSKKWEKKLQDAGVHLLWGIGRVEGPHTVSVNHEKQYTAKNILICTGSRPAHIPIHGADLCINYNAALALPGCPKKVALVGAASPIGMALAGIFAGFGAEVHVVCPDQLPLARSADKEMATFCLEQYQKRHHVMHMGYEAVEVTETPKERRTAAKTETEFVCDKGKGGAGVAAWASTAPGAPDSSKATADMAAFGAPGSAEFGPPRTAPDASGPAAEAPAGGDTGRGKGAQRSLAPAGAQEDAQGKISDRSPAAPASAVVAEQLNEGQSRHEGAMRGTHAARAAAPEDEAPAGPGASEEDAGADHVSYVRLLVEPTGMTAFPGAVTSTDERVISLSSEAARAPIPKSVAIRRMGSGSDAAMDYLDGCDYVIMDVGRVPNTQNLGLEKAGVKLGARGRVLVDKYLRSSVPSIWAAGDVTGHLMFQNVARMEGSVVARSMMRELTAPDYWAIPRALWSTPQAATVGMTEEEAAQKLDHAAIYVKRVTPLSAAITGSVRPVFIKWVVDHDTDQLKGLHMAGDGAVEILQGFATSVKEGLTKKKLDSTVGMHPTLAEELYGIEGPTRIVGRKAYKA